MSVVLPFRLPEHEIWIDELNIASETIAAREALADAIEDFFFTAPLDPRIETPKPFLSDGDW